VAVVGQAPAGIEGPAENHRTVSREDRLEPHLRGHAIDRDRPLQQGPRIDGAGDERDLVRLVLLAEIPRTMPGGAFGVGLDDDAGGGVILLRPVEHLTERIRIRPAMGDRGIAPRLVDHQHVAGGRGLRARVVTVVLRQPRLLQPRDPAAGAIQQGGVVQRMLLQKHFQVGGRGGVEIDPAHVGHQPKRRLPLPPRIHRPQKGVLDPDQRRTGCLRHRFAAPGIGRPPPDRHAVPLAHPAQPQIVPGQRQDTPHATLLQEPGVEIAKPPEGVSGGVIRIGPEGHGVSPLRRWIPC
jgi:hypothetical protein